MVTGITSDANDEDKENVSATAYACHHCVEAFPSNNKLHSHLRSAHVPDNLDSYPIAHDAEPAPTIRVIESKTDEKAAPGYGFRR
jgi:hypothetical protein